MDGNMDDYSQYQAVSQECAMDPMAAVGQVVGAIATVSGANGAGAASIPIGVQGVPVVVSGGPGMPHEGLGSPPPAKMMRRGEGPRVELRFLIPSKIAGVIIGRGGQSIKKIREDFAARISIPDSNGPERVMALEGDLGTVIAMLADLMPRMEEEFSYISGSRSGSGNVGPSNITDPSLAGSMIVGSNLYDLSNGGVDLRMLVHQSQIGCIIGRGGFNIRDLREKLPLKLLKVHPAVCPSSTDRVVQMVGPNEVVLQCVQKITEMLETSPAKGPRNNYNARSFDEFSAPEYGGFQSTRPDGMSMPGPAMMGRPGGGIGAGGIGGAMGGGIGGGIGGPGSGSGMPRDVGLHGGPMGDFGANPGGLGGNPYGAGGPSGAGMSLGGGPPGSVVPPGERTTTQVSLPDKLTGSIMGRGGARINQIRQQSGAEITINPQDPSSSDRIITIRGSTEQIQKAQFLMQLCVKKFSGHY